MPEQPANILREAWIEFIITRGPYAVFATVGFIEDLSLQRARNTAVAIVNLLNRSVFGKRWRNHRSYLRGLIVAETGRASYFSPNQLHFHLLVKASPGKPLYPVLACVLPRIATKLRHPTTRQPLVIPNTVDVQRVNNLHYLARYLTKQISPYHAAREGDLVGLMTAGGVEGLIVDRLPYQR